MPKVAARASSYDYTTMSSFIILFRVLCTFLPTKFCFMACICYNLTELEFSEP